MGMKIALDTNIFLNVKNKEEPFYYFSKSILAAIDDQDTEYQAIVSIIVITELSIGYYINNEILEKNQFLSGLYSNKKYKTLDFDRELADKSAELRSKISLKLHDCIILASALNENAEMIITNDSGFEKAKKFIKILNSQEFFEEYLNKKN
jgi:predicted nucleic acid-binding protein